MKTYFYILLSIFLCSGVAAAALLYMDDAPKTAAKKAPQEQNIEIKWGDGVDTTAAFSRGK